MSHVCTGQEGNPLAGGTFAVRVLPRVAARTPPELRVGPSRDVALTAVLDLLQQQFQIVSALLPLYTSTAQLQSVCKGAHPLHPDIWVGPEAGFADNRKIAALPPVRLRVVHQPLRHGWCEADGGTERPPPSQTAMVFGEKQQRHPQRRRTLRGPQQRLDAAQYPFNRDNDGHKQFGETVLLCSAAGLEQRDSRNKPRSRASA